MARPVYSARDYYSSARKDSIAVRLWFSGRLTHRIHGMPTETGIHGLPWPRLALLMMRRRMSVTVP